MMFLKNFLIELWVDGKGLLILLAYQVPYITSFPGVRTAINTALHDRTPASLVDLSIQVLMVVAMTLKAKTIVVNANEKSSASVAPRLIK